MALFTPDIWMCFGQSDDAKYSYKLGLKGF